MKSRRSQKPGTKALTGYGVTGQVLAINDHATFHPDRSDSWSVVTWFKQEPGKNSAIFSNVTSGYEGMNCNVHSGTMKAELVKYINSSHMYAHSTATNLDDGEWHHLVFTYDGAANGDTSGASFYIDAVQSATVSGINTLSHSVVFASTPEMLRRAQSGNDRPTTGSLQHTQFYDYELSQADVTALYDNGRHTDPRLFSLSGASAFLHYPFTTGDAIDLGTGGNDGTISGLGSREPYRRMGPPKSITDPRQLGPIKSWVRGNVGTYEGDVLTSLEDRGSIGGTFDAATNAHPVTTLVGGKRAPIFRGTRRTQSSAASSEFSSEFDLGNASLAISIHPYEVTDGAVIRETFDGSASGVGFRIYVSGTVLKAQWGSGSTLTTLTSVTTLVAGQTHRLTVRKSGTTVYFRVDGEAEKTTLITLPSSSVPDHAPTIGNSQAGDAPFNGLVHEVVSYELTIDTTGRDRLVEYLLDSWDGEPDDSAAAYDGLYSDINFDLGVTIATGISAVADQSGMNEDLTQATTTAQMAHTASDADFSGYGSAQGAAGDYIGRTTWLSGAHAQVTTQYVVVKTPASTSGNEFITRGPTSRNDVFTSGGGGDAPQLYGGGQVGAGADYPSTVQIIVATFNGASLSRIQVHAESKTVLDVTGNGGTLASNGRYIGGNAGANSFTGKIARVLDYDADFNSNVLALLKTKYGITTL